MDSIASVMVENTLQITARQPNVGNDNPPEHFITDTTSDCDNNMLVLTSTHIHSDVLPSTNTENHSIYQFFSSINEVRTRTITDVFGYNCIFIMIYKTCIWSYYSLGNITITY